jgi:hypothetical protein
MKLNFWLALAIFHFVSFNFFYSFIHEDILNENDKIVTDNQGIPIMNPFSNFWNYQSNQSFQQQTTTSIISIDRENLRQPQMLKVETSGARLNGHITINKNRIIKLTEKQKSINISSYLFRGENIIEISGIYSPQNSQITIEFFGTGNQITQQTSGSGILKHMLIVNVR